MPNYYFGGGIQSDPMDAYRETAGMVKQSRLAKLLGGYYQNGQADLGQIAQLDPNAAQAIQKEQQQRGLAKMFADVYGLPEDQRKGGIQRLLASGADLGDVSKLDPSMAAQSGMFAQKVGEDGYIYNAMRDGRMVNTGIKADRQMWFRDNPGMNPELVGKDGNVRPVGSYGPQAQAAPDRGDMEADIALANQMIKAGIAAEQVDAFIASRGQVAESPAAQASFTPAQAKPVMTPAQILAAQNAQAASQRADRAEARAQENASMGAIPPGMRLVNGRLEPIPGAPVGSNKPMPVGALKSDLEIEDALGASEQVFSLAAKHLGRMGRGELVVGTPEALGAKARTFLNMPSANDVNLTELNADKTAIVNASLRLNKGVQTEGDAQRAVNELMSANDHKTTLAAMKRLIEINKRAVGLQQRKRELLRSNYGQGSRQAPVQPSAGGVDDLLNKYGAN